MKYDPGVQHRKSMRLRGYDYSQRGRYFVTICTQDKECLFGAVSNGVMHLNSAGEVVQAVWTELPSRFPGIECDCFVVMPNHVHGIIWIVRRDAGAGLTPPRSAASSSLTLSDVVRAFKSLSAIQVNKILSRSGHPLWQRSYFEHIIRNDQSLRSICNYIETNPQRWGSDPENQERGETEPSQTWLRM